MKNLLKIICIAAGCALLILAAAAAYQYHVVSRYFEGVTAEELKKTESSPFENKIELVLKKMFFSSYYDDYVNGLDLKGSERVMDFGAGAGTEAYYLAKRLEAGKGTVVCVDISETWLKVARNRLAGFSNVEYIAGDIRSLPVPKNSFDAVVIHFVIHDIPVEMRNETLRAVAGVMKPGARLYIREPAGLKFHGGRHGITREEIMRQMKQSGLVERQMSTGSSLIIGDYSFGVFVKP